MGHKPDASESYFEKMEDALSPVGRDARFTFVFDGATPEKDDEVLVGFEFGDKNHDVDGRDFLVWQRQLPDIDVMIETINIAHEGLELV